jgi:arylsulfatase A-like enzyme
METIDEEFLDAAKDFITRKHAEAGPWFCYFNTTRMHIFTHLKKESQGKTGLGVNADGMVETDGHVGQLLKLIDDLGVADNTVVVYTTDNGYWRGGEWAPF